MTDGNSSNSKPASSSPRIFSISQFIDWLSDRDFLLSEQSLRRLRSLPWLKDTRALHCLADNKTIRWLGLDPSSEELLAQALLEFYPLKVNFFSSVPPPSDVFFSSGSTNIDAVLRGGFSAGSLYEFCGEPASGKTQLCYSAALSCYSSTDNFSRPNSVFWIDTEGSFLPDRLNQSVRSLKACPSHHFAWLKVRGMADFLNSFLSLLDFCQTVPNVGLVVIDSFIEPLNKEFADDYPARAGAIREIVGFLKRLSRIFSCTIIFTNQVRPPISPHEQSQELSVIPLGGYSLSHATEHRFLLEILEGKRRSLKVLDSHCLPSAETAFYITDIGVSDSLPDDYSFLSQLAGESANGSHNVSIFRRSGGQDEDDGD